MGVGAIVVTHGQDNGRGIRGRERERQGGQRKRLAISNLTNNSAIGDTINGDGRSHRRRSVFRRFSGARLRSPFREAAQLPRERIIIALTTNPSRSYSLGIIDDARFVRLIPSGARGVAPAGSRVSSTRGLSRIFFSRGNIQCRYESSFSRERAYNLHGGKPLRKDGRLFRDV